MASRCPKCHHNGAHFVPPCFGDEGFFACLSFCDECRELAAKVDDTMEERARSGADGLAPTACGCDPRMQVVCLGHAVARGRGYHGD